MTNWTSDGPECWNLISDDEFDVNNRSRIFRGGDGRYYLTGSVYVGKPGHGWHNQGARYRLVCPCCFDSFDDAVAFADSEKWILFLIGAGHAVNPANLRESGLEMDRLTPSPQSPA